MADRSVKCLVCGFQKSVDGIGSKVNPKGTWLLRKSLPIVCKSFDPAGDLHDELYARGGFPKDEADSRFKNKMNEIANNKMWGTQWHFHFWKNRFYKYVSTSEDAQKAYDLAQKQCEINQSCLCLDGLECPIHPKPFPA